MKIVICGSIELSDKIIEVADKLEARGLEVKIPQSTMKIRKGELTLDEFRALKKKHGGDFVMRKQANFDFITDYYNKIKDSDGILVLNLDKNGIENYIGGNALMELGFARVLGKKIYLYNPIPQMFYTDEIRAVEPTVINGDLGKIK
ncbi:MAG: hypothetical protein ABH810_00315 [bacterium]